MARSPDRIAPDLTNVLVSVVCGVSISVTLWACHQPAPHAQALAASQASTPAAVAFTGASTSLVQPATLKGTRIGDTATFGAMIVALRPYPRTQTGLPAFKTSYTLSEPAHLIWLEVIPGRSIALLFPTSGSPMTMAPAGERAVDFRYSAVAGTGTPVDNTTEQARDNYYRCIDAAERSAEEALRRQRASQPKPQPKRDKDGRIIEQAPTEANTGIDLKTRKQIEARCQSQLRPSGTSGDVVQAERYLVMLASYVPITAAQLNTRLNTLEVTASNVKGTIEAIAQGLYLDPHAVWAGHYVPW